MTPYAPRLSSSLAQGVIAGLAGTVVMTAFQKLIEMPITGRSDSYAPANLAQKVLGLRPRSFAARKRLNYGAHFALGALYGAVHGLAGHFGLRGQPAVAAVFATFYPGDVLLNTALGLYHPTKWSRTDVAVDVIDKLVLAQATGAVFDRVARGPQLSQPSHV